MSDQADTISGIGSRSYSQWVTVILHNVGSQDIKLTNLNISGGKLYADGNKDKELPVSMYNNSIIHPHDKLQFNACGRENAPEAGTTGDFDVVDPEDSDKVIRHFYWDCPWNPKPGNTWTISQTNAKWLVESSGGNFEISALGIINVEFRNI